MSQVGLHPKLTLTQSLGYRMFGMVCPGTNTCGREERKQDWARVKLLHSPNDRLRQHHRKIDHIDRRMNGEKMNL